MLRAYLGKILLECASDFFFFPGYAGMPNMIGFDNILFEISCIVYLSDIN